MYTKEDIQKAQDLGNQAFYEDTASVPYLDKEMMKMIAEKSEKIGDSIPALKAWNKGYTLANLAASLPMLEVANG